MKVLGTNRVLYATFLFCGCATLMLGVALPEFERRWQLADSQSGMLLAAQFIGLFAGALTIQNNLRRSLQTGCLVAMLGYLGLLVCCLHEKGFAAAVPAVFVLGLGIGQMTTTVNLLAADATRSSQHRSARLSMVNFAWSIGALLAPFVTGWCIAHRGIVSLFTGFLVWLVFLLAASSLFLTPAPVSETDGAPARFGMPTATLAFFALVFFLYGGLELTVSGWLSTYALRYSRLSVAVAAYSTSFLWMSFALGRFAAGILLRWHSDRAARVIGVCMTLAAATGLRFAGSTVVMGLCSAAIGLGLGPFFPITLSRMVSRRPSSRQAGQATSATSIGQAAFPYLVGVLSTRTGSLRVAMIVPGLIAASLLAIIVWSDKGNAQETAECQG